MKTHASVKQVRANRENAQNSTGPKTPEGKAKVSFNALTHGLTARWIVISDLGFDENQAEFDSLLTQLRDDCKPEGILEQMEVEKIAAGYWRLGRVARAESAVIVKSHSDMQRLERQKSDLRETLCGAAPGLADFSLDLYTDPAVVNRLIEALTAAKNETVANGSISDTTLEKLFNYCGRQPGRLPDVIRKFNSVLKHGPKHLSKLGEKMKELLDLNKLMDEMVEIIDGAILELRGQRRPAELAQKQNHEIRFSTLMIPSKENAELILRYGGYVDRQLSKALDRLNQLQSRRLDKSGVNP